MRKWFSAGLVIALLTVVLVGGRWHIHWTRPFGTQAIRANITIPSGSSLKSISKLLEKSEVVRDAWSFEWFVRWNKKSDDLQAGQYILTQDLTYTEVMQTLLHGRGQEIRITIPEGTTIHQIDGILTQKQLIEAGDFSRCASQCRLNIPVESLEGWLFPSTYYVDFDNFSSRSFIERLYRTFREKVTPLLPDIPHNRQLEQIVVVASMIEREAFGSDFEEKALISGVIWKRLDEGIALGIDATSRYEKMLRTGADWKTPLYVDDFANPTPYNTRRQRGLPPTAIANPGVDSLRAAVYPQTSKYYYYLHDRNGKIHFSENLERHNAAKAKYLQ